MRIIMSEIRTLLTVPREELMTAAKNVGAPYDLVVYAASQGKLPVVNARRIHGRMVGVNWYSNSISISW